MRSIRKSSIEYQDEGQNYRKYRGSTIDEIQAGDIEANIIRSHLQCIEKEKELMKDEVLINSSTFQNSD